jgi:hypothetical protein
MKRLLLALLFACPLAAQTPVTIQNPSFETFNALTTCNSSNCYNTGPIPSWKGSGGSVQFTSLIYSAMCDGPTVAYSNGGTLTQDLGISAQSNGTYSLNVCVGHRLDGYAATATIQLLAGTTSLCSLSVNEANITAGTFSKQTLSCPTTTAPTGDLTISLGCSTAQCDFDAVSLTFQPTNPPLPTETLTPTGSILYNDGTTLFPSDMQFNVTQLQGGAWVTIGNPTLSAIGQLGGGNIVVDPNFVDANGFVQLRVQMTGIPMFGPVGFPQATFTHGSTGLTVSAVLVKSDLSVKSFHLDLTP